MWVYKQKVGETRGRRLTWGRRGETEKKTTLLTKTDTKRQEVNIGENMQESVCIWQGT